MSGATYSTSVSTQLPVVPNTQDPELYKELVPVYDAIRALNIQAGGSSILCTAAEALNTGDIVQILGVSGVLKAQKASAASAGVKEATGYVSSQSAVASGSIVSVNLYEGTAIRTGLTVGSKYYLSATVSGGVTTPAPSSPNLVQFIGVAISSTELAVHISLI